MRPTSVVLAVAAGVLVILSLAVRPRPHALRGERLPRLVLWGAVTVAANASLAMCLVLLSRGLVRSFLASTRQIGVVESLRAQIDRPGGPSPAAVGVLVLVAVVGVGAQHVVRRPFSARAIGRTIECIPRTTGRVERAVSTLVVCCGGALEDVSFRQGLPAVLHARGMGPLSSLVVALAVFALLHGRPARVANALAVGAAATIVYVATGSLVWPIALHVLANALALGVMPEIRRARATGIARRAVEAAASDARMGRRPPSDPVPHAAPAGAAGRALLPI